MPVHLRYHKPREPTALEKARHEQPMAIVKMQNPRLLLACEGENFAAECPDRMVSSYCDSSGSATAKCEYLSLPYKAVGSTPPRQSLPSPNSLPLQNVNSVEVSVPVGNLDHTLHVVALTTLIVSGGTIYLMVSLFRKSEHVHVHES